MTGGGDGSRAPALEPVPPALPPNPQLRRGAQSQRGRAKPHGGRQAGAHLQGRVAGGRLERAERAARHVVQGSHLSRSCPAAPHLASPPSPEPCQGFPTRAPDYGFYASLVANARANAWQVRRRPRHRHRGTGLLARQQPLRPLPSLPPNPSSKALSLNPQSAPPPACRRRLSTRSRATAICRSGWRSTCSATTGGEAGGRGARRHALQRPTTNQPASNQRPASTHSGRPSGARGVPGLRCCSRRAVCRPTALSHAPLNLVVSPLHATPQLPPEGPHGLPAAR